MEFRHLMVDLETYGTTPGSIIRSIGAVMFDPTRLGMTGAKIYRNITEEDQEAIGLTRDQFTVNWWARQSEEARDALEYDKLPLKQVCTEFSSWFRKNRGVYLWSQGSNFDGILWEEACKAVGQRIPWRFYNTRDTRTVYDAARVNTKNIPRAGTYHNALADAEYQVLCVQTCYEKFKNVEPS